jgi:hypothetical protein
MNATGVAPGETDAGADFPDTPSAPALGAALDEPEPTITAGMIAGPDSTGLAAGFCAGSPLTK